MVRKIRDPYEGETVHRSWPLTCESQQFVSMTTWVHSLILKWPANKSFLRNVSQWWLNGASQTSWLVGWNVSRTTRWPHRLTGFQVVITSVGWFFHLVVLWLVHGDAKTSCLILGEPVNLTINTSEKSVNELLDQRWKQPPAMTRSSKSSSYQENIHEDN